jgi:hypothetical protein
MIATEPGRPGSPYTLKPRQVVQARCALAQAADLLRMEGKFLKAEKLYREAAKYTDGGAAAHLNRLARFCRSQYNAQLQD